MALTEISGTTDRARIPRAQILINWNGDGSSWVDETQRLIGFTVTTQLNRQTEGLALPGAHSAAEASVVLDNPDSRFSPDNAAGPLYALINPTDNVENAGGFFREIRIFSGFAAGLLPVFRGVITDPQIQWRTGQIVLKCHDRWAVLNRIRASTVLQRNKRPDELIATWLAAAGVSYPIDLEISERIFDWAWLDDDPIAQDFNAIVLADGGLMGFRGDGTLVYKSATWPARLGPSVAVFRTNRFEDLEPANSYSDRFDQISVAVRGRYVAQQAVIWEGPADLSLAPGETRVITAHFRDPLAPDGLVDPVYNTTEGESDWVARNAANQILEKNAASVTLTGTVTKSNVSLTVAGAGTKFLQEVQPGDRITIPGGTVETRTVLAVQSQTALAVQAVFASLQAGQTASIVRTTSDVSVSVSDIKAQRATVTLVNNTTTGQRAYVEKLQLRGQVLAAAPESRAEAGSAGQVFSVDSVYIGNAVHGQAIASMLRQRFRPIRQTLEIKAVPAMPHLEIADPVTVIEEETGINRPYVVGRIAASYYPDDLMDLSLIDARDFTAYSADTDGYFIAGQSAYGPAGVSGAARIFY